MGKLITQLHGVELPSAPRLAVMNLLLKVRKLVMVTNDWSGDGNGDDDHSKKTRRGLPSRSREHFWKERRRVRTAHDQDRLTLRRNKVLNKYITFLKAKHSARLNFTIVLDAVKPISMKSSLLPALDALNGETSDLQTS